VLEYKQMPMKFTLLFANLRRLLVLEYQQKPMKLTILDHWPCSIASGRPNNGPVLIHFTALLGETSSSSMAMEQYHALGDKSKSIRTGTYSTAYPAASIGFRSVLQH
jgi:hypothetical protein